MATALGMVVAAATGLIGVAVARSLRDEAVLEGLRAEVRSIGEVQRAVHEARASVTGRSMRR